MGNLVEEIRKKISKQEKEIKQFNSDKEMYQELINQLNKRIMKGNENLINLRQKLDTFENEKFISDHALLRYLERSGTIDVKKLKAGLLCGDVIDALYMGAEKVHINGFEFRIKNGKITTIIKEDGTDE